MNTITVGQYEVYYHTKSAMHFAKSSHDVPDELIIDKVLDEGGNDVLDILQLWDLVEIEAECWNHEYQQHFA